MHVANYVGLRVVGFSSLFQVSFLIILYGTLGVNVCVLLVAYILCLVRLVGLVTLCRDEPIIQG